MPKPVPPNEPGRWTLLEATAGWALWRRERSDPYPIVQFYVLAPPRQAEVFYREEEARACLAGAASRETRAA